jgi:hypothetical protein
MKSWFRGRSSIGFAILMVVGSIVISSAGAALDDAGPATLPKDTPSAAQEDGPDETAASGPLVIPWLPPLALSRGDSWTCELFGPPNLRYDAALQQFTIAPPDRELRGEDEAARFGPELVAVRRAPFRLQLVGYFGEGADATGTFANLKTGETFLARAGRAVPELGLTILKFSVVRQPVSAPESMTTLALVARAEVMDSSSGEMVILTDQEYSHGNALLAELRIDAVAGHSLEVREGEEIQSDAIHFRIMKMRLNPPELDMARLAADGTVVEQRTVVPAPMQSTAERDHGPLP